MLCYFYSWRLKPLAIYQTLLSPKIETKTRDYRSTSHSPQKVKSNQSDCVYHFYEQTKVAAAATAIMATTLSQSIANLCWIALRAQTWCIFKLIKAIVATSAKHAPQLRCKAILAKTIITNHNGAAVKAAEQWCIKQRKNCSENTTKTATTSEICNKSAANQCENLKWQLSRAKQVSRRIQRWPASEGAETCLRLKKIWRTNHLKWSD